MSIYLSLQRGSSGAGLKSPAKKAQVVAIGKRQKALPRDDPDSTSSSEDEKDNHSPVEDPSIQPPAIKRRKAASKDDDDDDEGSPVRKAGAVSTKRRKTAGVKKSGSSKKLESVSVDLLPKAAYPPELGYSNDRKVVSECIMLYISASNHY